MIVKHLEEVHPRLVASITRMTRDPYLAEEIAQETCIVLIKEFRKGTDFKKPVIVYATVVARRRVYSYWGLMRTRYERSTGDLLEDWNPCTSFPAEEDPTAGLRYLELLAAVRAAVGDEQQMKIWEMRHVWGLMGREIAELLNISQVQVSRNLKKAEGKAKCVNDRANEE
ncbi:sigma-70 family RNA polymerase sigma factor [Streptomyces violarus]|uniref:sigma-70 family RNA polymerase sigma factor n=1 Tax=Streptomyces violarus TaxID=67380 RepID=UPI0021C0D882|nr:sigma-70 family RNA polymerase sigma factor [Streptomyces violarus]MCT9141798.1 sigma-70 family RNA polymerase sigma factor [Streptomyces violarus]